MPPKEIVMPEPLKCGICGKALPLDTSNRQCVPCLLSLGLDQPDRDAHGEQLELGARKVTNWCEEWQPGASIDNGYGFGRWEVLKVMRGGMGLVYIVFDHTLKCRLAMKGFRSDMWERHKSLLERFEKEATTWVKLPAHPNVVQAHFAVSLNVVERHGEKSVGGLIRPFLFLEYINGGDLAAWIGTKRLTEDLFQVLRFAIQFCDGMRHLKAAGILAHRDIKPSNCLIDEAGTLKVTDFGIAKVFNDVEPPASETNSPSTWDAESGSLSPQPRTGISFTGAAAGTCAYMSPEQFRDSKRADQRADIYSFGVMIYEMLSGRLPFLADTWNGFKQLHEEAPLPPLQNICSPNACVTRELNELVRACLAKQPDLRIQDFGLLRGRLALLYHQLTGETLDPPTKASSSRSVTLADQGANLLELGSKYDDVMPLFEEALRLEPSNDYLWLRKGLAIAVYSSTTADLMQDALLCFETALKLNPNNTKAWLQKGHALASLGRHQHSLECYNAVLRLQPRDRAAYAGKGWRLAALGQKKEALAHFEAALRLDPRDREFASYLCVLRGASTTKNDGMDLFRQTVYQAYISPRTTVAPSQKNGETNLKSVRVCLKQQEEGFLPERIEGSFEQFFQQGLQAISAKQFEEALACFGRALEINPSSEIACNSRGRLLDALGSHEEALACFERLLAMSPRLDKAWYGMASALRNLGRHDAALDCYDHALQINPLYADAAFGKGQAAQNLRRFHQALSFYDRTTEIDARFQQAWAAKGVCMAMLNRHREALRSFEKALELDPREGTTWFHKGLLLLNALRNYPEALICFEQAKSLGNPQADHGIWLTKQMLDTKQ